MTTPDHPHLLTRRVLVRSLGAAAATVLLARGALTGDAAAVGRPCPPRSRRGSFEPEFDNREGTWRDPDLVIAGGRLKRRPPKTLECSAPYVIYSSAARNVRSCEGHGGPADGGNDVLLEALANARAVAARIGCPPRCAKKLERRIWSGWGCHPEQDFFVVICAVEIEIVCEPEL